MSAMSATEDQRKAHARPQIDRAAAAAASLVTSYYQKMDTHRASLKTLYKESSAISWNGHAFTGPAFREFYLNMPASEHRIEASDAHPVLASQSPETVMVTTFGTVKFTNERNPRKFHSTFFLTQEPGKSELYIASQCFRWV
ncbi:hypothetical protein BCR44DRAFT_28295 [Catenaria anguillulae PL171]|uniref:NTF2-related export protein n=1 Tax=Catenaria anguillulae PL171 TaxID=765915 RepID=A0A1Y2I0J2_9FUNG|nr:hypothetical protein BCR44DRAFT_28295 [Catenaria anguillulae PL171]